MKDEAAVAAINAEAAAEAAGEVLLNYHRSAPPDARAVVSKLAI